MTLSLRRRVTAIAATLTTAGLGAFGVMDAASTATFGQSDVNQDDFVAIAAPRGTSSDHQLLVVEQVSDSRKCWSESGAAPTLVDPLLATFDFTGICGRSTDSNGYSIRVDGQDLGLRYSLRVVKRNGDLVLIGAPDDRSLGELEIARANGLTDGFAKLNLEPGWKFTKRTYNDQVLGHVYLTYDSNIPIIPDEDIDNGEIGRSYSFPDIDGDVYAKEIQDAVDLGFVAGFYEDNTFRPQESLTREQIVSMVLGALDEMPNVDLDVPTAVSGNPYPDVSADRWSATKIQFAKDNNIISGYEDGTFRPSQAVTRAELMAILRRASEYGKSLQSLDSTLWPKQETFEFNDTASHWAAPVIDQMSSYCGVASPLNETGTSFYPDSVTKRNYAAAATLRMLNCVKDESAAES